MTTQKTKKIKVMVAIILSVVLTISGIFISISLIKTSNIMKFENPDKIIVYFNSNTRNIVFEPTDNEYKTIYTFINDAHKQTILTSIFNGQLFKDADIMEHDLKNINFDGINVSFVYNSPQIAKLKNKIYSNHIWYQTLMFKVSSNDGFSYNSTAIISPKNIDEYPFDYSSHYVSYSNLKSLYNYLIDMFN